MCEASECLGVFVCLCPSVHVQSDSGCQHMRVCNCLEWVYVPVFVCQSMCEVVGVVTHPCVQVSVWSGCMCLFVSVCACPKW